MRRFLLLPLLLLVSCGKPKIKEPTLYDLSDVLMEEFLELTQLTTGYLEDAIQAEDTCLEYQKVRATLSMASAKAGALARIYDQIGDMELSVTFKAASEEFLSDAVNLRRKCG